MKKILAPVILMLSISAAFAGPEYKECSKNSPAPPCQFAGIVSAFYFKHMLSENTDLMKDLKSYDLKITMPTMKALFTKKIQSFYLGEEGSAFVRHEIRAKNASGKFKIYVDHPMRGEKMYFINTIEEVSMY